MEMPNEAYLVASACPARLRSFEDICLKNIQEQRNRLTSLITGCLERGIQKKEFWNVPIQPTARFFISSIIGLMRQEALFQTNLINDPDIDTAGLKEVFVMFCRRSIVRL
jgi:hypothetical protein